MSHHLEKLQVNLSTGVLFPEKPLIRFAPNQGSCPAYDSTSRVWKTRTREVATLRIGHFTAHETQTSCPCCVEQPVFLAEELQQLVPPGARYGYDVLVFVGQAIFLHCRNGRRGGLSKRAGLSDRGRFRITIAFENQPAHANTVPDISEARITIVIRL